MRKSLKIIFGLLSLYLAFFVTQMGYAGTPCPILLADADLALTDLKISIEKAKHSKRDRSDVQLLAEVFEEFRESGKQDTEDLYTLLEIFTEQYVEQLLPESLLFLKEELTEDVLISLFEIAHLTEMEPGVFATQIRASAREELVERVKLRLERVVQELSLEETFQEEMFEVVYPPYAQQNELAQRLHTLVKSLSWKQRRIFIRRFALDGNPAISAASALKQELGLSISLAGISDRYQRGLAILGSQRDSLIGFLPEYLDPPAARETLVSSVTGIMDYKKTDRTTDAVMKFLTFDSTWRLPDGTLLKGRTAIEQKLRAYGFPGRRGAWSFNRSGETLSVSIPRLLDVPVEGYWVAPRKWVDTFYWDAKQRRISKIQTTLETGALHIPTENIINRFYALLQEKRFKEAVQSMFTRSPRYSHRKINWLMSATEVPEKTFTHNEFIGLLEKMPTQFSGIVLSISESNDGCTIKVRRYLSFGPRREYTLLDTWHRRGRNRPFYKVKTIQAP